MPEAKREFARSLRTQTQGNQPDDLDVRRQRKHRTGAVPGEGGVPPAPGAYRLQGSRAERSAAQFAPVVGSRYGGGSATEGKDGNGQVAAQPPQRLIPSRAGSSAGSLRVSAVAGAPANLVVEIAEAAAEHSAAAEKKGALRANSRRIWHRDQN